MKTLTKTLFYRFSNITFRRITTAKEYMAIVFPMESQEKWNPAYSNQDLYFSK